MPRYLSITSLWRFAIPKSLGAQEFEPGGVSTLVFTGTGTGVLEVAWPRDAYPTAAVRVVTSGAPGSGLRVALSLDAAVTWGPSVEVPASGEVETPGAKALVLRCSGTGFAAGDRWGFSTTASPELVAHAEAAEDEADGYLAGTLRLPLTSGQGGNGALQKHVASLAVESLMRLRGVDPRSVDWQVYRAGRADALEWLKARQRGELQPGLVETAPGVSVQDFAPPPDPPAFVMPL